MDGTQVGRRLGLGGAVIGIALGALLVVGSAAASEAPDPAPVGGGVAGCVGIAAELAAVSWAAGGAVRSQAAPSGDAWASTRQFPGRPH